MSLNARGIALERPYGRVNSAWPAGAPPRPRRSLLSVRAGLAELVLINRLRARMRCDAGLQMLERAAHIIDVTSRHWFGEDRSGAADRVP